MLALVESSIHPSIRTAWMVRMQVENAGPLQETQLITLHRLSTLVPGR